MIYRGQTPSPSEVQGDFPIAGGGGTHQPNAGSIACAKKVYFVALVIIFIAALGLLAVESLGIPKIIPIPAALAAAGGSFFFCFTDLMLLVKHRSVTHKIAEIIENLDS